MGLDMYLEANYEKMSFEGLRGACGGLMPWAPKSKNEEIGYWRKNYELSSFMRELLELTEDDNCVPKEMSIQDLEEALLFAEDCVKCNPCPNWINDIEWNETVDIFENAISLIKKENAKIYYREWY